MPHINELIDFVVTAYIVQDNKVLLVDHKKVGQWLGVGGHIELDEDSDEALVREIKEECVLEVELLTDKPALKWPGTKPLHQPHHLDIHPYGSVYGKINLAEGKKYHRHLNMVYFAKAKSNKVKLEEDAHNDIRWFSESELDNPNLNISQPVKWYAQQALKAAKN